MSKKESLLPHSEKLTLPYVALLTTVNNADEEWKTWDVWKVSMSDSSDPEFSFVNTNPRSFAKSYVDAFEVCSKFLALQSPEEALTFFQRYGPFELLPKPRKPRRARSIRWSRIQQAQSDFKAARMCASIDLSVIENEKKKDDWHYKNQIHAFVFQPLRGVELSFRGVDVSPSGLGGKLLTNEYSNDPDVDSDGRKVYRMRSLKPDSQSSLSDAAIVNCEDVVTAVRASIFLRRMNGFQWKRCARKGCNKVFEVSRGRDKRIYCTSGGCGHLVAVKNYNARQKEIRDTNRAKPKSRKGRK
jgi:hypothetical protein